MATYYGAPVSDSGGSFSAWTPNSGSSLVDMVSETTPDGDTTYIASSTHGQYAAFNINAISLPSSVTIQHVRVYVRARMVSGSAQLWVWAHGQYTPDSPFDISGTTYTDYFGEYAVNPDTGVAWTKADVEGTSGTPLVQGFGMTCWNPTGTVRVTQAWLLVTYTTTGGGGGTTFYASPTGSGSGTEGSPFSFAAGIAAVGPGDTLLLRGGDYNNSLDSSMGLSSGTAWTDGNYVRIANYPGETVWLRPTAGSVTWVVYINGDQRYIEFDGINVDGSYASSAIAFNVDTDTYGGGDPDHIRWKNAEILGSSAASRLDGYSLGSCIEVHVQDELDAVGGFEFINLTIHGGGRNGGTTYDYNGYGIYLSAPYSLIEGCDIYDTKGAGIHVFNDDGDVPHDSIVRNNRVHDITRSTVSGQSWGIIVHGCDDVQVYNNVVYGIRASSGGGAGDGIVIGTCARTKVWHNTVYDCDGAGILLGSATSTEIRNNISYANGTAYNPGSGTSTTHDHNLEDVDPSFNDSTNLRLQAGSVARDYGTPVGIQSDHDGNARDYLGTPDAGAYEYVAPGSGTTYYAATTGVAGANGDSSHPRTLAEGIAGLSAGDTLLVRSGTYDYNIVACPSGTSWSNKVRIANYPGETVWLIPSSGSLALFLYTDERYIEFDGINVNGVNTTADAVAIVMYGTTQPHHIRIKNATIIASQTGSETWAGSPIELGAKTPIVTGGIELINLTITGGGRPGSANPDNGYGIYCAAPNNLIEGCDISNNKGAGIMVYNDDGAYPDNNIIRNNRVHDQTRWGVSGQAQGICLANGSNNQVYNNLVHNCTAGDSAGDAALVIAGTNNQVFNNTLYNNLNGINVFSGTGHEVKNNISFASAATNYVDNGTATDDTNNLIGVDPLFQDAPGGNFNLTASSPAIGYGTPVGLTTDFAGVAYNATAPAAGAYEFGIGSGGDPNATTFYASPTAASGATGTSGDPFQLLEGVAALGPGKTLLLYAGNYDAGLSSCPSGTSWTSKVRIAAVGDGAVWIKPVTHLLGNPGACVRFNQNEHYIEFDGINFDGRTVGYGCFDLISVDGVGDPHHIRVKNATLLARTTDNSAFSGYAQWGIGVGGSGHPAITGGNEFINCDISGGGRPGTDAEDNGYGIFLAGPNNLVEGCDIHDTKGAGVYVNTNGSDSADNNVIRNNIVRETRDGSGGAWCVYLAGNSNQVYNNELRDPVSSSGRGVYVTTGNANQIKHNTISAVANGIGIEAPCTNTEVKNNIVANGTGTDFYDVGTGTNGSAANNLFGTNPLFVGGTDYHLQAGSPAINAGADVGIVGDHDGAARDATPDYGAYEYGGATTPPDPGNSQTRLPIADAYNGWTSSGANIFSVLDDAVGTPDEDATYMFNTYTAATNWCFCRYEPFVLPAGVTVLSVQVIARARMVSGTGQIQMYITTARDPTGDSTGEPERGTLTTSYADYTMTFTTNPATGLPWTQADVEGTGPYPLPGGSGAGIGVGSVNQSAGSEMRMTQLYAKVNYASVAPGIPTSDGSVSEWTPLGGSHYENVDDAIGSPDDDTSYVYTSTDGALDNYDSPPFVLTGAIEIASVQQVVRAKLTTGSGSIRPFIIVNGSATPGTPQAVTSSWVTYTETWTTNPDTGLPWTQADVEGTGPNPLGNRFGFSAYGLSGTMRVTQTYLVVNTAALTGSTAARAAVYRRKRAK